MRTFFILCATTLTLALLQSSPASALNDKSWIASNGQDTADCSRTTPCASFTGAYAKTNAFGEIICVDGGGFFSTDGTSLNIIKSITINCESGPASNLSPNGFLGLTNVTVAAGDVVVLRGIDFDLSSIFTQEGAIQFKGAGTLIIDHAQLAGSRSYAADAIYFEPNGAGKLIITDSLIHGGGNGMAGAGIRIAPQPGGTAQVTIKNSTISHSTFGVAVDGSTSTGGINATIVDSVMTSNINDGIVATTSSSGAPVGVAVLNSQSINNGFGIRSIGNATVRVDGSKIIGNGTGVAALSGGALLSAGNNLVEANATNGAFTGAASFK